MVGVFVVHSILGWGSNRRNSRLFHKGAAFGLNVSPHPYPGDNTSFEGLSPERKARS